MEPLLVMWPNERSGRTRVPQKEKKLGQIIPVVEPWVDAKEIAKHLGYSLPTIRNMAEHGVIPCSFHANGARKFRRFRISDVDIAFAMRVTSSPSSTPRNRKNL